MDRDRLRLFGAVKFACEYRNKKTEEMSNSENAKIALDCNAYLTIQHPRMLSLFISIHESSWSFLLLERGVASLWMACSRNPFGRNQSG